jgi:TPR repeat protein
MYLEGLGTPKNEAKAFEWYMASAERGYAPAQHAVGNLFDNGIGITEDDAKAAEWYGKAADQLFPYAQHNLALMYKEGRGVPRDLVRAYMWMLIASANLEESRDDLGEVRDALTPEQVEQGQQMVIDWVAAHQN